MKFVLKIQDSMSSENLAMSTKRFASHSDEEILRRNFEKTTVVPVNTKKGNNNAAALLREYLREKEEDARFESFDSHRLAEVLCHFYVDVRMQTGELYKVTTLESIRYGLNRYLKSPPHLKKFDIIKDTEFIDANESFKTMTLEAKAEGKGDVEHKKEILSLDLQKLYSSVHMDCKTPSGLANKVQFDIRFYFFRRGAKNMESMTKDTFEVAVDPSNGIRFIRQGLWELTKNHSEDRESYGACMPEIPNSELCPVSSYLKYIEKLNPDLNRLWQYPKDSFTAEDNVWYTKKPLGKNTLAKFMSTLSASCNLSTVYTNHCVRVTGATILTRCNYSSSQFMSLTGHKSVQSLAIYQQTSNEEKFDIGSTLTSAVTDEKPILAWQPTPVNPSLPPTPVILAWPPTPVNPAWPSTSVNPALPPTPVNPALPPTLVNPAWPPTPVNPAWPSTPVNPALPPTPVNPALPPTPVNPAWPPTPVNPAWPSTPVNPALPPTLVNPALPPTPVNPAWPPTPVNPASLPSSLTTSVLPSTDLSCKTSDNMADELGKIVRPQSPTRTCSINPVDKSHIGLILSESRVTEKSCERLLSVRANEIVCALSSKTIYLSNSGQVISNIDLPYYWCNFCTFKTEEKHQLLTHLMDHRFSCQYCVFQTFSRVDVVRHTVQEHSEFDGSDLKVCVLLPDLLKHGLNQSNDMSKKSPKDNAKSNSESELETKSPDSKRKRIGSADEDEAKKNKVEGPAKRGRTKSRRGRSRRYVSSPQSKHESEHNVKTGSEEENKVTERMTRSSPKLVKKERMPGVCFECSVCKFRTFKKAILGKHTELEHDIARPKFALKIVTLSQAQEIDASDEKNKGILKDTVPSSPNVKRKTEKRKGRSAPLPEPEPSKKDTEEEEEEEEVNDAVVEMDYAEEDDEDENENAEVDEETNKDHEPDMKSITEENNPVLSDPTKTVAVVNPSTYTCLLCSTIHDSTFSAVKNHYLDGHPGGTLVMGEVTAGSSVVQWIYFCVGTNCIFNTTNPVSWMEHSRMCQREAYETPNLSNSQHASVKNTVNAVKENMMLTNQTQPCPEDAGKSLNASAPQGYGSSVHIKTEPKSPTTIYVYESAPACDKEGEMFQDQQQPVQPVQGSLVTDSVSSSSSSSAQAVSTSVPVAVVPIKDPQSQNAADTVKRRMNSQLASSAVSSTSTDKSNSNTRTSATNSSSPSAIQSSNTSVNSNNSTSLPSNNRNNSSPKALYEKEQTTRTRSPNPSNLPSGKTSGSSSKEKSQKTSEGSETQFDVEKKGNYKCAHCRFLATKALEVRVHMLERHKMNPLYGLDMLAEECKVARFMLFCPKGQCTFCTKDKDFFLKHLDKCSSVDDARNFTDEYKRRLEITRNFALSTLKKLQMLTQ
ncbi:uncharacterized protein LOC124291570 [Haliotis rubra]|uniref:uncharacterized protein LOC124291570 n=1 Tax=Haliotis rubra TaxID=36100 RepID=UPI001EE53D3B|nr:uncharacterized protein LOC124291570 [Haliotis rubra]